MKTKTIGKLIIILIVVILLLGGVFAYLYFGTDLLKTNEQLFFKYLGQLVDSENGFIDSKLTEYTNKKMTGKYEDALRFYKKLLQIPEAQTSDWLNTGHIYTAMNQIPKAIECYRKVEKRTSSRDEFLKIYLNDKDALLEQGVTEENIYLIPDLL